MFISVQKKCRVSYMVYLIFSHFELCDVPLQKLSNALNWKHKINKFLARLFPFKCKLITIYWKSNKMYIHIFFTSGLNIHTSLTYFDLYKKKKKLDSLFMSKIRPTNIAV